MVNCFALGSACDCNRSIGMRLKLYSYSMVILIVFFILYIVVLRMHLLLKRVGLKLRHLISGACDKVRAAAGGAQPGCFARNSSRSAGVRRGTLCHSSAQS